MLNPERRGAGGSSFEIGRDDPGNQGGSRFEWDQRYVSELRAPKVSGAGGARGDDEGGRHFASGEPESVDAEWLLAAARALIEAVRAQQSRFPKDRRD